MKLSNAFSAVDVDMHCQKAADGFLAVHVLFGGVCWFMVNFSAVDVDFSAVHVLFGGGR